MREERKREKKKVVLRWRGSVKGFW